ncbi:hypothetical protein P170DRAFT_436002 [Aspergillus steynii IBT 23096]|uniref:Rhodopsin domain-containing protein n=1 Tax=Aspergillus steynii IBT 23096 TaxID=1392250 RepID=A0A2I2GDH4_9EURO|nr:uncharacterized protein P170DRAFT_436002 [Aspergillus steynii IBT 23096]PLB50910.1 hypothetical protein P170DRAFT_436002 [Aspergillus steynii IBT 23096]
MVLSFALGVATAALEHLLIQYGIGRHLDDVDLANLPKLAKLTLISSITNLLCTMTLKISLSIFLLRMVEQANRTVQRLVILNLIILIPFTVAVIIVDLVQCIPLHGYWDNSVNAKCIDTNAVNILLKAASAVGAVTDFMTAAIPIIIIHNLQMPARRKYILYAILALGFFITGASIVKTVSIDWNPEDYTWDNAKLVPWAFTEQEGGVIVGCLVTLRPIWQLIRSRISSQPLSEDYNMSGSGRRTLLRSKQEVDERGLLAEPLEIKKQTRFEVLDEAGGSQADGSENPWEYRR